MRGSIVGCARNCGRFLPDSLRTAVMLSRYFDECTFVFYENDSTDDTLDVLNRFCQNDHANRTIITEKNVQGHRESRLAHGRKAVFQVALQADPLVVVVMDMDDVNRTVKNFTDALQLVAQGKLTVASANQKLQYYDLWALRSGREHERCRHLPAAVYCHIQRDFRIGEERFWLSEISFNLIRSIRKSNTFGYTEVVSAFGGLAIYDAASVKASVSAYSGVTDDGFEVCEHVPFHEDIVRKGGHIGIVHSFINSGYDDRLLHEISVYTIVVLSSFVCFVLCLVAN